MDQKMKTILRNLTFTSVFIGMSCAVKGQSIPERILSTLEGNLGAHHYEWLLNFKGEDEQDLAQLIEDYQNTSFAEKIPRVLEQIMPVVSLKASTLLGLRAEIRKLAIEDQAQYKEVLSVIHNIADGDLKVMALSDEPDDRKQIRIMELTFPEDYFDTNWLADAQKRLGDREVEWLIDKLLVSKADNSTDRVYWAMLAVSAWNPDIGATLATRGKEILREMLTTWNEADQSDDSEQSIALTIMRYGSGFLYQEVDNVSLFHRLLEHPNKHVRQSANAYLTKIEGLVPSGESENRPGQFDHPGRPPYLAANQLPQSAGNDDAHGGRGSISSGILLVIVGTTVFLFVARWWGRNRAHRPG